MEPNYEQPGLTPQPQEKPKRDFLLPASIMIAAVLISVSLVYNAGKKSPATGAANLAGGVQGTQAVDSLSLKPVTAADHILGDPKAPIVMVEFSDLECPFCKRFQATLHQLMNDFPGKLAWVYRHFPLDAIHPKSRHEAEAAECANALGGNTAFWNFIDKIFEITPSNNGLDPALLTQTATEIGLNTAQFQACLDSGKYASIVNADVQDGLGAGTEGTPNTILVANGKKYPVMGALPYDQVKLMIQAILAGNQ
jgi:protein-disulfide isomerase